MTLFEGLYLSAEPLLPHIYWIVRRKLMGACRSTTGRADLLDVGGRKSHYTIGIPANIVITDLPRQTEIQHRLNLGINEGIADRVRRRRSNVKDIVLDDMTTSSLEDASFDVVVAVEVLEHVEEDARFVREVHRVLRPGGVFIMTTPNGDFIRNTNPDHKRHYTRDQLRSLLSAAFDSVEVEYAVRSGIFHRGGLYSWSPWRPWLTIRSMVSNVINAVQSSGGRIRKQPSRTCHLVATAWKQA